MLRYSCESSVAAIREPSSSHLLIERPCLFPPNLLPPAHFHLSLLNSLISPPSPQTLSARPFCKTCLFRPHFIARPSRSRICSVPTGLHLKHVSSPIPPYPRTLSPKLDLLVLALSSRNLFTVRRIASPPDVMSRRLNYVLPETPPPLFTTGDIHSFWISSLLPRLARRSPCLHPSFSPRIFLGGMKLPLAWLRQSCLL